VCRTRHWATPRRAFTSTTAFVIRSLSIASLPDALDNEAWTCDVQSCMKYLGPPQSGSLAGTTASHNRAGQYLRNRRTPVNPAGTGRKGVIKSAFGSASSQYAKLTSAQQAAWAAYATGYPITDSLGQSITLTGQQMYVSINTALQNVGQAQVAAPPSSNATTAVVIDAFIATHPGTLSITLAGTGAATDFVTISLSRPLSGGVNANTTWWQQTVVAANLATAIPLGTAYVAQFGDFVAGQRIFVKLTPVNQYGVTGTPTIAKVQVT